MNNRVVDIIIRAKDLTASVVNKFRASMRQIGGVVREVTRAMAAFVAGTTAMVFGLTKVAQQGAKVNDVKAAFARITGDEVAALEELREASGNTISDLQLMADHNQALALGTAKSTEEFARMLRVSKELGDALGLDGAQAMERFSDVLASGSVRAARALGLEIKAGMTRNEILEEAERVVGRISGAQNAGAEAADRFATAFANAKDRVAEFVAESPLVASFLDTLANIVTTIANAIVAQDWQLLADTFETIGETMADALIFGVNKGLEKLSSTDESPLLTMRGLAGWLGEKLFGGNADEAAANLATDTKRLQEIFRRGVAAGAGAGGGGGSPVALPGIDVVGQHSLFDPIGRRRFAGQNVDLRGTILSRRSTMAGVTMPRLAPRLTAPVGEAADDFDGASQVFVASMGAMTEAAIRGGRLTADSIVGMITNIVQSLPGVGGLVGAAIGAVGGIFGALFSRRKDAVPVRVDTYGPQALAQMTEASGPLRVTSIVKLPDGSVLSVEEVEREQLRRQRSDEIVRYGSRGHALRG